MLSGNERGLFALSVDVRDEQDGRTQSHASQLLKSLHQHRIPATWALPAPGTSPIATQLVTDTLPHEVAILGDDTWVGQPVGRTTFARELAQRVKSANAAGLQVRTLAILDTELEENLDLLVKHRISLVRSASTSGFQAQSLRFGVWRVPVSFTLPSANRWTFGGQEWAIGRALTKASKAGDIVHLVVDLKRLANQSEAASVDRVLSVVRRRQSKGLVIPITLCQVADLLAPRRRMPVSRSVLRAA